MALAGLCVIAVLVLAGCKATPSRPKESGRFAPVPPPPAVQRSAAAPAYTPSNPVDAIIYSELPKPQMLEKLRPYAALMEMPADITQRGLVLENCRSTGPGVHECAVKSTGLRLVFDPAGKLRVIRRDALPLPGGGYPKASISEPGFEYKGYRRQYPE